ncbi:hypothetical protein PHLGIDRAFT_114660 [Phlebiopsis gigantea 11061_1 CR5-6]|uniref:Uncharacterized protein n=1 Tax=Phlebiopsis gigantea (strain 11061_1 CR5-6) TaxID=745531 RepID=A0A0C3SF07_PHLG1|nr:hypothetical protein PHLGIDRAFT_114660 [Phlebiopsis gigantea 11061_1 CR5-6]
MLSRAAYTGVTRSLAIAFDVGTTYSGASFAILDPGEEPKVQTVTRYPGQDNGDAKIPSVLYYTEDGSVFAAGAEAMSPAMRLEAEDDNLIFVEWWKLHLCPASLLSPELKAAIPPLPPGKDVMSIFGDFLQYLFTCAKQYIVETYPEGATLWNSVVGHIEIILSHPNGWEGVQQTAMRTAAVRAGLVSDDAAGHGRVHFVTEGEASVHYCLERGVARDVIKDGETIIVVDAGGGTVDITTYTFVTAVPILMEEVAPPDCLLQGSTQVNARASVYLQRKLEKSTYGNEEDVKTMIESFEQMAKPTFRDDKERAHIRFGSARDKDPDVGIRHGQLVLEGHEMAAFFKPSIDKIVAGIHTQRILASHKHISTIFLVGGFASSPWLCSNLQRELQGTGMKICRPDSHANKAVAEGAMVFYLSHFVSVRVTRYAYGTSCVIEYRPDDPDHVKRRAKVHTRPSGRKVIPNSFNMILAKGTSVREQDEVFSQNFYKEASTPSALNKISTTIVSYRGSVKNPKWADAEPEQFTTLCTVFADTTAVKKEKKQRGGSVFYTFDFRVVLQCGLTELKAQISWTEGGVERRGAAKIVYDDDTEASV